MNASAHRVQRCQLGPLGSGVMSNYKPLDVSAGNRISSLGRAVYAFNHCDVSLAP